MVDFGGMLNRGDWEIVAEIEVLLRILVEFSKDHWQNFESHIEGSGEAYLTYEHHNQAAATRELDSLQDQADKISEYERKVR